MNRHMYSDEELFTKVKEALIVLFGQDHDLLHADASERSITHKLAEYLQRQFRGLNVDCEYNRRGHEVKKLEAHDVLPDVVIHRRLQDTDNLLVIEVKINKKRRSASQGEIDKDRKKLERFTSESGNYKYALGLFMLFDVKEKCLTSVRCFMGGCEQPSTIWNRLDGLGYGK